MGLEYGQVYVGRMHSVMCHRFTRVVKDAFFQSLLVAVRACGVSKSRATKIESIAILSVWQGGVEEHDRFVSIIRSALEILRVADSRWYPARIRKYIATIYNGSCPTTAAYYWINKSCCLDFVKCQKVGGDLSLLFAKLLIHEACHGRIRRLGVITTRQNYARIENLCEREEERFVLRMSASSCSE